MMLKCGEHWHDASPTALVLFCEAMMEGETVQISATGVHFRCVKTAITEERVLRIKRRYKGNKIIIDGEVYDVVSRKRPDGGKHVA